MKTKSKFEKTGDSTKDSISKPTATVPKSGKDAPEVQKKTAKSPGLLKRIFSKGPKASIESKKEVAATEKLAEETAQAVKSKGPSTITPYEAPKPKVDVKPDFSGSKAPVKKAKVKAVTKSTVKVTPKATPAKATPAKVVSKPTPSTETKSKIKAEVSSKMKTIDKETASKSPRPFKPKNLEKDRIKREAGYAKYDALKDSYKKHTTSGKAPAKSVASKPNFIGSSKPKVSTPAKSTGNTTSVKSGSAKPKFIGGSQSRTPFKK